MWKLRCMNGNEVLDEKTVKFTNIIGRSEVRSFFAQNGMAMTDLQEEVVFSMERGTKLEYFFGNKVKYIEVINQ